MALDDYLGAMGGIANIGGAPAAIQNALLGNQTLAQQTQATQQQQMLTQQDQMKLQQQQLAQAGQAAAAQYVANPTMDDATFQPLLQTIAAADPNAAYTMSRQRQMIAAQHALANKPDLSPTDIAQFGIQFPDAFKATHDVYSTMQDDQTKQAIKTGSDIYGYLNAAAAPDASPDQRKQAIGAVINQLTTLKAAAGPAGAQHYDSLIGVLQGDLANGTNHGAVIAGMNLAGAMGPQNFAENVAGLDPAAWAKRAAETSTAQTTATMAPAKQQADIDRINTQNATDIVNANVAQGRLVLDRDTLAETIRNNVASLEQKYAPSGNTLDLVNKSSQDAAQKQQIAGQESDLADRIQGSGAYAGAASDAAERAKAFGGWQNQYSQFRQEYNQLKNEDLLSGARGAGLQRITDTDVKLLNAGFPAANSNPGYIANFLRAMANLHTAAAAQANDSATWAAANGSLGPARRPFVMDGMRIPAGMTFAGAQGLLPKVKPGISAAAQGVVDRVGQP